MKTNTISYLPPITVGFLQENKSLPFPYGHLLSISATVVVVILGLEHYRTSGDTTYCQPPRGRHRRGGRLMMPHGASPWTWKHGSGMSAPFSRLHRVDMGRRRWWWCLNRTGETEARSGPWSETVTKREGFNELLQWWMNAVITNIYTKVLFSPSLTKKTCLLLYFYFFTERLDIF